MKTVFISHSNKDQVFVKRLAGDLSRVGIRSWITDYEILPGDRIIDKITEGIDQCDYMLVVISDNSIQSTWVSKEIGMAAFGSRRIIPLRIDDAPLPPELAAILYIDFTKNYQKALQELVYLLLKETPRADVKVAELVDVDDLAASVGKEAANYKGSGYSITTALGILTLIATVASAIPAFVTAFGDRPKVYYSVSSNRIEIPSPIEAAKVKALLRASQVADSTLRIDVINAGDAVAKEIGIGVSVPGQVTYTRTDPESTTKPVWVKIKTDRDPVVAPYEVGFLLQELVATRSVTALVGYCSDDSSNSPKVDVVFDGKPGLLVAEINEAPRNSWLEIFKLPLIVLGAGLIITILLGIIAVLRANPTLVRSLLLVLKELNPAIYRIVGFLRGGLDG